MGMICEHPPMTESCKLRVLLPSTPPVVAGHRLCHSSQDAANVALRKPIVRELHQLLGAECWTITALFMPDNFLSR
jgi:hypothetical protein